MGIIKSLTKTLTSWYNEKEALEKTERVDALEQRAVRVANETDALISSYRHAEHAIAASRRK